MTSLKRQAAIASLRNGTCVGSRTTCLSAGTENAATHAANETGRVKRHVQVQSSHLPQLVKILHTLFVCQVMQTNQPSAAWSAVGQGAGRNEHEVVCVRVAVKAAAADVACRVLICTPIDASIVHETSVRSFAVKVRASARELTCRECRLQRQRPGGKTNRRAGCVREGCA